MAAGGYMRSYGPTRVNSSTSATVVCFEPAGVAIRLEYRHDRRRAVNGSERPVVAGRRIRQQP
ncbi:hypothetical protein CP557_14745 [Natrinema ejinorense]|uniref:Uncharacterized protein n=1 Tax=Natrinema ejinorense TaxID=373386 RepID=A0A2A5QXW2_9EURY|nr:hypothetical protein CP557_14745 [Natrinema ejinorense]